MLFPVILCGGSGTRLWPLSRGLYPKQFMELGGHTLFRDTLNRCMPLGEEIIAVCNEEHRFYVAAELQESGMKGTVLLEPAARNTAPAIALAAFAALHKAEKTAAHGAQADVSAAGAPVLLVLPADHSIKPVDAFVQAVREALPAAQAGKLVTFGIVPTSPATGFGYIVRGQEVEGTSCYAVSRFQEKPDLPTAKKLCADPACTWNSGMFLMRADVYLAELQAFAPDIYASVAQAWKTRSEDRDFIRPEKAVFSECPKDSIDYAVMEKTQHAAVLPVDFTWNDLGSWEAFYEVGTKDDDGNVCTGDVIAKDSQNCYIHSQNRLVAALGLHDISVVETKDAVLVASRDQVQNVKAIVASLEKSGRDECYTHPLVYRPWGSYETLALGKRFQVKRIIVNPGAELSLQLHHHRAEHWVVVSGTAEVTNGDKVALYTENQSTYIPLGTVHRLKNPGVVPLVLIEIQSGSYLGEDDIVRLEDVYGR